MGKETLDNTKRIYTEANMWEFALDYLERFQFDLMANGCIDVLKVDKFLSDNIKKFTPDTKAVIESPPDAWKKYPEERPTDYGKYWVYRKGCDKTHLETWNNTGWAYNNKDITHFALLETLKPKH
jgi:hypothetical protein